jgi:hypothetical protein
MRPDCVFAESLPVFPFARQPAFSVLQSRVHEIWARFFGSSLEDRLRYTPSDCFETFPFPDGWESIATLDAAGHAYYEFRAALMVRRHESLTATYNDFHDPEVRDADTDTLRALHTAMDRAVLDAYGWTDLQPTCEFLLDYEIDEGTWSERKKKPYRYRWPDDVRDEVLAQLLELNATRHAAEVRAGLGATKKKVTKKNASRKAAAADSTAPPSATTPDAAPSGKSKAPRRPTTPLDEGGLFHS